MELWTLSAGELAQGIARRDFSSAEVVEAHLRRIEAVNSRVNAIVKVLAEEARAAAAAADRKVAAGENLGVTLYETVRLRRFSTFAAGNGETRKGLSLVFAANTRMSDGRRRAA